MREADGSHLSKLALLLTQQNHTNYVINLPQVLNALIVSRQFCENNIPRYLCDFVICILVIRNVVLANIPPTSTISRPLNKFYPNQPAK